MATYATWISRRINCWLSGPITNFQTTARQSKASTSAVGAHIRPARSRGHPDITPPQWYCGTEGLSEVSSDGICGFVLGVSMIRGYFRGAGGSPADDSKYRELQAGRLHHGLPPPNYWAHPRRIQNDDDLTSATTRKTIIPLQTTKFLARQSRKQMEERLFHRYATIARCSPKLLALILGSVSKLNSGACGGAKRHHR